MSLPETPGKDPSPPHHPPPDGTLDGGADPLLQSGAFIDAAAAMESNGVTSNGSTPDGSAGRAKAKGSDPMSMDWLPAGWRVEYKVRTSGATAGSTDRVRLLRFPIYLRNGNALLNLGFMGALVLIVQISFI